MRAWKFKGEKRIGYLYKRMWVILCVLDIRIVPTDNVYLDCSFLFRYLVLVFVLT